MDETDKMEKKINYKKLYVTKHKGIHYYPKTIPKERDPLPQILLLLISFGLFLCDYFTDSKPFSTVVFLYSSASLFSIFLQYFYRLVLISEESKHLISRYNGSIMNALNDSIFHFNKRIVPMLLISFTYNLWYVLVYDWDFGEVSKKSLILCVPSVYFVSKVLKISDCPLNDSLWVAEDNGLDYGSGMAYSFFHGYLNLLLPKTGREDKNLKEFMQDYESKNQIAFNVYKLFILIPESMTCPVSLENEDSSLQESSSLEEKVITVAGVQNRVYKNAVYKIISENGDRTYVVAEYATPLKTFKEVCNSNVPHSDYYNKLKKDIILQFYITLNGVLEDTGLNQFCELVYFKDTYIDSNGELRYHDVGKIIQARIKELRKKK
ncbi:unnamed protein product [Phyllotreta striolata]|uniref:STING ligand-binding domain-containing protein n=1 Tax=Phyllotreta striolata TaxID=444603 RepID=A0A9N9TDP9_PHYSR|nr:unnamed protein product [Phyllotreta striolata]